ncbi:MAG TPA: metal ABC transporter ATP-binding protein [Gemmatimonadaceae bacterium]|nr:metal ABC transporter ATP-binding protein [Gemmatimonadaceae bacterium]
MPDIATISHLTVSYEGTPVLKDLSFAIEAGSTLAIVGPNGSGKSTLLRALLGMIPYEGTITWAGPRAIGYVPQKIDADRRLPVNVRNLLAAKAGVLALTASDIDKVIGAVGLDARVLDTPVGQLSGGEFQRGLLAFAILGHPRLLLLDEPTASIDHMGQDHLYEMIHRLQEDAGMTVVLVSHDLNVVQRYATRVLGVSTGEIALATPRDPLTTEVLEGLYGWPTSRTGVAPPNA